MGTMKVGKEDEKSLRPMFPRVHVSDTEKGGPRAPPRNKMALYEQLSIPLHKFSSTTFPPQKPGSVVAPASSIQGGTNERITHSLVNQHNSMPSSSVEKLGSRSSDGKANKTRSGAERNAFNVHDFKSGANSLKTKYDDDNENDDFRVPTFAHSEVAPRSTVELKKPAFFGATNVQNCTTLDSSIHVLISSSKPIHEAISSEKLSRKRERIHAEQEFSEAISSKEHGDESPNNPEAGPSPSDGGAETDIMVLEETGRHSFKMGHEPSHDGSVKNRNACKAPPHPSCSRASFGCSQRSCDGKANGSGELKHAGRSGEVLEDSMVDSISVLDISPDDVVGVIGPKQFWKARRAIANQQRVFAIQVFELHRLIEVQKLFASSPHLLLDNSEIITIDPKETTKSLPVSSAIKYQQIVQQTDHSTENLAQNADSLIEKTASFPIQAQEKYPNKELSQFPRNVPPAATTHLIPSTPDNRANSWPFQPPPNQWLIPVMSPSEGLIYKPYAGPCPPPGFISPLYGACGPLNMPPSVSGDFGNSPYVFPSSHPQQHHILPCVPPVAPNYFPSPYGVPIVNPIVSASAVEQISPLTNVRSNGRSVQRSQSSCNISIKKSEALSGYPLKNKSSSKDNEIQVSTASSPFDKVQGEGRDFVPGFMIPPASEGSSVKESQTTHVIKVIPHNARSATESAARIFRSIQRERRQHDL